MNEGRDDSALGAEVKVGFIGLGNMGMPMARCILDAGRTLIVQDISASAIAAMPSDKIVVAGSPRAVGEMADIVLLSLPTPDIVTAVCTGPNGLIQGDKAKIVVDLSTTGPRVTERLAEQFAEKGVRLIDAPVSGGVGGAERGELTIMASGDRVAYGSALSLLNIIGKKVFYIGEKAGLGQSLKLVNNTLCAANAIAAFEVLALGTKLGLNAEVMLDVLNASSGQNFITSVKIPQCVMPRTFPPRFATNLMYKDVRLCVEEAEASGAVLWLGQTVKQILAFAIAQGDGERDFSSIIQHYEKWAGTIVANNAAQNEG